MSKKDLMQQHSETFESIRHFDENSNEYWLARQLSRVLEYSEYRHFLPFIKKAKEALTTSKHSAADHFEDILEMVDIGSGAKRNVLPKSYEAELVDDMISLMSSFSARIYGRRSAENQRKKKEAK